MLTLNTCSNTTLVSVFWTISWWNDLKVEKTLEAAKKNNVRHHVPILFFDLPYSRLTEKNYFFFESSIFSPMDCFENFIDLYCHVSKAVQELSYNTLQYSFVFSHMKGLVLSNSCWNLLMNFEQFLYIFTRAFALL